MENHTPDFRNMAREALERARTELRSDDPVRLRYAALELRDAMEALTYDRANAWKDHIPPEEYKTWQPRRLMAVLLEIDPSIGSTSTIAFGIEDEYGKPAPPEKMTILGTDNVLTMAEIKKHYDALGSYLHVPSLEQIKTRTRLDANKLRQRCDKLLVVLEKVLSSPVWNITLGATTVLPECMNESCKKPVRKRITSGKHSMPARCFECGAEYTITTGPENKVTWKPNTIDISCSTPNCPTKMQLWHSELVPGTNWKCDGCGAHNVIRLSVSALAKS